MTQYNEWKIWNGGECPVEPGTMGQVQFDNESRDAAAAHGAGCISEQEWGGVHDPDYQHIIAYRTVKEPVVEVESDCIEWRGEILTIDITLTDGKVTAVELAK